MKKTFCIVFLLMLANSFLIGQVFLNLDFEYHRDEVLKKWFTNHSEAYELRPVTTVKNCGGKSLLIESKDLGENDFGVCTGSFPVDLARGKEIILKGKIKTDGVENHAGLWLRIDGPEGPMEFDNMQGRSINGSSDWSTAEIVLKADMTITNINFGAMLIGEGKAWFDCIEIYLDGEKYVDPQPRTEKPTEAELAWLRKQIIPLHGYDPNIENTADLDQLKNLIGDGQVLALGEVTHGSSEIFQMKHRITKYLKEQHDFDIFTIEGNMPEARKVDDYIVHGKGNSEDAIKGMYFWTWSTREVQDMVEWMRTHNVASPDDKIRFSGNDMQYYSGAISELREFVSVEKVGVVESIKSELEELRRKKQKERSIPKLTQGKKKFFKKNLEVLKNDISNSSKKLKAQALQNVRIIEQYITMNYQARDQYMAENLLWIKKQNPDSKMITWAHNAHIQESDGRMGKHLDEALKDDYVSIGFAFHQGQYTAQGQIGLTTYNAEDSYPGTYEYFFKSIEEPIFLLDLRNIPRSSPESQWIYQNLEFRMTGAVAIDKEFNEAAIYDDFDMIIFINSSTPSELFDTKN